MIVCDVTRDQTKAQNPLSLFWSLTIEPLWYQLTTDASVPLLTIYFFIPSPFLMLQMVSLDVNAVLIFVQWGSSEKMGDVNLKKK